MMDSEARFADPSERQRAIAAYYGLCSWLDHNVGRILAALDEADLGQSTRAVYTSDHGDNIGARGLWGKSNPYRESVCAPLIMAGPGIAPGTCDTPVSLLDLSHEIAAHFGCDLAGDGRPLSAIAAEPPDPDRVVFSEYHAAGAISGAFMLRRGRWKLNHYVGFPPELFDLPDDPEETRDLGQSPVHAGIRAEPRAELRAICDPKATDAQAFAEQAALVERMGGREAALRLGAPGATPPPEIAP